MIDEETIVEAQIEGQTTADDHVRRLDETTGDVTTIEGAELACILRLYNENRLQNMSNSVLLVLVPMTTKLRQSTSSVGEIAIEFLDLDLLFEFSHSEVVCRHAGVVLG